MITSLFVCGPAAAMDSCRQFGPWHLVPTPESRSAVIEGSAIIAAVTFENAETRGFGSFVHHHHDRYLRFLQLDRQNRNIFTSQEK